MRSISKTVSGVGSSAAIPLDTYISPFNIGFGAVITGTVDYTIEHTFDNVLQAGVTPTWFPHPTVFNESENQDGNYAFPVMAVRLTTNAGTTGSVTLTVIQAGVA
jgi:hypothetical protein